MAIPNNLSKYLFSLWQVLYDESMEKNIEIKTFNNAIFFDDKLFWLLDKHGKYDKMKNNVENLIKKFNMQQNDIYFENEYPIDLLIGKPDFKKWESKIIYYEKNKGYKKNDTYICFDLRNGQIKVISPTE